MDDLKTSPMRDPRRLLKRMRELMAVQENAQARLDHLTAMIAEEAGWDVCSIYLARQSNALELCATYGLKVEAVHTVRLQPAKAWSVWSPAGRVRSPRPTPAPIRPSPTSRRRARSPSTPSSACRSCVGAEWSAC